MKRFTELANENAEFKNFTGRVYSASLIACVLISYGVSLAINASDFAKSTFDSLLPYLPDSIQYRISVIRVIDASSYVSFAVSFFSVFSIGCIGGIFVVWKLKHLVENLDISQLNRRQSLYQNTTGLFICLILLYLIFSTHLLINKTSSERSIQILLWPGFNAISSPFVVLVIGAIYSSFAVIYCLFSQKRGK